MQVRFGKVLNIHGGWCEVYCGARQVSSRAWPAWKAVLRRAIILCGMRKGEAELMRTPGAFFAACAAALVLLLGSCAVLGIDRHDRIASFTAALNSSDRSTINGNFDQALTANLPTMDAAWWSTNFPVPPDSDHTYTVTLLDYADPGNVIAAIMGPPAFNSNTGTPRNAVLVMSRQGIDWFIARLYLDGSSTPLIQ
jgi:hypothetical protein